MKINELIPQLKWCGYECEAGKLECNIAFRQICDIINRINLIYKQQSEPMECELYTRQELDIRYALEKQINYILTGCLDKNVVIEELKKMGYYD